MQYYIFMSVGFRSTSAVSHSIIPYKNNRNVSSFDTIGLCTPTTKEGKGKMIGNELLTSGSMFWSLQIMMHCYSGTSDISWALHTSGNVTWHSMVVGYWCFRPTYWAHLQGWSSHVMMNSRLTLLNMVCSNALALVDCGTQNDAMIASFWLI